MPDLGRGGVDVVAGDVTGAEKRGGVATGHDAAVATVYRVDVAAYAFTSSRPGPSRPG